MAAGQRVAGTALYVKFNTVVLTGDHTSFSWDNAGDNVDLTAADDTFHYYAPMRANSTFTLETYYNAGTETVWDAVVPNAIGSLEVGPIGTAAGSPKYSCTRVLISGRPITIPFDGGVSYTVSMQASAAVSESTY